MSVTYTDGACSTRVPRVQFGVPPNCGEQGEQTYHRPRLLTRRSSPVSGGTPEATRGTRVLQMRIGSFRHA